MVTREEIESKRTPAGGWTRKQLEEWGVKWPPSKGWKYALEHGENPNRPRMSSKQKDKISQYYAAKLRHSNLDREMRDRLQRED